MPLTASGTATTMRGRTRHSGKCLQPVCTLPHSFPVEDFQDPCAGSPKHGFRGRRAGGPRAGQAICRHNNGLIMPVNPRRRGRQGLCKVFSHSEISPQPVIPAQAGTHARPQRTARFPDISLLSTPVTPPLGKLG